MHIRDGFLSPEVCVMSGLAAAAAVGYSLHRLKDSLSDRTVPLTGMMSSLIFAGQMVNFPLPVPGVAVSGHLLGGVLAGVVLGPWAGCVALALVLFVQLALFADGGWTVLGANVLNMSVVGCWGGYALYSAIRRFLGNSLAATTAASVIAAWASTVAGAILFALEFRLSWPAEAYNHQLVLTLMTVLHCGIGVGEALITGLVVSFVCAQRPDLIAGNLPVTTESAGSRRFAGVGRAVGVGVLCALLVAGFLAPFASSFDDGLDTVASQTGFNELDNSLPALVLEEYSMPVPSAAWEPFAVSLAGIFGVLAVLAIAWALGQTLRPRQPSGAGYGG